MNIEEERKAFEIAACMVILKDHPDSGLTVEEISGQRDGDTYISASWAFGWWSWLAAKEHAAEMAKPIANIRKRKDHHQWAVYIPSSLTAEAFDFPHKQDAVAWAVERGYRVTE